MNIAGMLTAAAAVALFAGTAAAQTSGMSGDAATTTTTQPASMSAQGSTSGTMQPGSMPAQPMAQGSMSTSMSAPACLPPVGAAASGGMSGTGPSITPPTMTASANGLIMCTSGSGTVVVSNAPIPDSPENRARTGGPESRAGKMTAPRPGVTTRARRRR